MPSASNLVSHLLVTSIFVAVIFRVHALRGIVTGIQSAPATGIPSGGTALYI